MDQRLTLGSHESFLNILTECMQERKRAEMIIDINGLERKSGMVSSIEFENGSYLIVMEDKSEIDLKVIVAVNGLFLAEYSGC